MVGALHELRWSGRCTSWGSGSCSTSSGVLVILNAGDERAVTIPELVGQHWELSPVQRTGADEVVNSTIWQVTDGRVRMRGFSAVVLVRD